MSNSKYYQLLLRSNKGSMPTGQNQFVGDGFPFDLTAGLKPSGRDDQGYKHDR